jgi:U11/U12 small nuclear ribonucleoprotein SNRNP48
MKKQLKEAPLETRDETRTEQDYKRRRPSYRGKKTKKTPKDALRELIEVQMLDLSENTGDKIVGIDTKHNDIIDSSLASNENDAWNWKKLIGINNPLLIRDMCRHPQPSNAIAKRHPSDNKVRHKRRSRSSQYDRSSRQHHQHHRHSRSRSRTSDRKYNRSRTRGRSHSRTRSRCRSRSPNQSKRHQHRHSQETSCKQEGRWRRDSRHRS